MAVNGTHTNGQAKSNGLTPHFNDGFRTGKEAGVKVSNSPAIKNGPLPADGSGYEYFPSLILLVTLWAVPAYYASGFGGGLKTTLFFALFTTLPVLAATWIAMSALSPRINDRVKLPGRPVEFYLSFKSDRHRARWNGRHKIPMQTFLDLYLAGKVDVNGDCLDVLEYRHDWATFGPTLGTFRYLLFTLFPSLVLGLRHVPRPNGRRDSEYDRKHDALYLGSRMAKGPGIISDASREETLDEMQDNSMSVVCQKLSLRPADSLLVAGCGWGDFARFASVRYAAEVTGTTSSSSQALYGSTLLREADISDEQSQIVSGDINSLSGSRFDKIALLELEKPTGTRRLASLFRRHYDLLQDDGVIYVQATGARHAWQYEDFIWDLFLCKNISPVDFKLLPLVAYTASLEAAGFEIKSVDSIGVHYSGTLWRWYKNWLSNAKEIKATFGDKWFRTWELFFAYSTIAFRQGSANSFQIVAVKNLNSTQRIQGLESQYGIIGALAASNAEPKQAREPAM